MNNSLKQRTGFAIFWNFIDKGGQQAMQLVFGVLLARILLTSDLGTFALLAIFTAVANILQESGFSSALIRKRQPTEKDFTSVFFFNIFISFTIYLILFLSAPLISMFYNNPQLTSLARVVFLSFVFNSFGIVQNILLVRKMDFKTNTKITLIAFSISGIIAVILAIRGYGVWSLAAQLIIQSFLRSLLLWIFVKWTPSQGFHLANIRAMLPYSSKLLVTAVMNQVCVNLYTIIIGKFFSIHQAGVYSQGYKYGTLPQSVISDGIRGAAFPALTKVDSDANFEHLKRTFRKIVRISAFASFPISILIVVIAKPTILILLTQKWADAISILQIVALGTAFYPLYSLIGTLLQTIGRTGLIFKLELSRNIFALVLILFTIKYGVLTLVMGMSVSIFLAFAIGMAIAGRHIKYSFVEIIKDTAPFALLAAVSIFPFLMLEYLDVKNLYLLLILPPLFGFPLYLALLKLAGSVILDDSIEFFKNMIFKNS